MPFLAALAPIAAGAATAATATSALGVAAGVAGAVGGAASAIGGALSGHDNNTYSGAPINTEIGVNASAAGGDNQQALEYQKSFVDALGSQGIGNQQNVYSQLQGIANGTGPNPAQAMLNQATGANVANQAALMAGQRGASQNVGMIARQAGQQGSALQQQAAGQGATMQANQSLNAIGQMGNIAGQQVNQRANAINMYGQQTNAQQQNALNAIAAQNNAQVAAHGGANQLNAQAAGANAAANRGIFGGMATGIGSAADILNKAGSSPASASTANYEPVDVSPVGNGVAADFNMSAMPGTMNAYRGGQVDMTSGGHVAGQAKVAGDSIKNDTVAAKLSPQEIVLPRSITMHPNAPEMAAEFVRQQLAKHGSSKHNFAAGGMFGENEAMAAPPPPAPARVGSTGSWDDPAAAPMGAAPAAQAPAAPPMQGGLSVEGSGGLSTNPSDPYALQQQQYDKGYTSQLKGIEGEAAATGQLGQMQAGIEQRTASNIQREMGRFEQEHQKLIGERQKIQQDIQTGKIDPNRYLGSMETSQKFSTALGLIMGGIGQGLMQSGENPALTFLNKQIDNDIKAQQTNLSSKESLLSANMQQMGDLHQATQMTKVTMLDMAAAEMRAAAAKAQNPMAQARALQAAGQLEAQAAPIMSQMAFKRAAMQGATVGGDPARMVPALVPESHQKEVFHEIGQAQNATKVEKSVMASFDQARKENTFLRTGAGYLREPASILKIKALALPLIHDLEGRVNEFEQKTVNDILPRPGDTEAKIDQKRDALLEFLEQKKAAPTAKGFGIDLTKYRSTAPQQGRIKTKDGATYEKVPGGWKKVQ